MKKKLFSGKFTGIQSSLGDAQFTKRRQTVLSRMQLQYNDHRKINQISNLCTKALYVLHVLFGCRCVQNILSLPSYSFVYSNKRKGNGYRDFFPGIGLYCQQLQGHDAEFKKCFTLRNITIYSSSFVSKSKRKI